jgi:Carboxypeptidase regulatory-like domain
MNRSVPSRARAWRHGLVIVTAVLVGGGCSDIETETSLPGWSDPLFEERASDRATGLVEAERSETRERGDVAVASCGGNNGGWSYCDERCPCGDGQGDCDGDDECASGLVCMRDTGVLFGFDPEMDMCLEQCAGEALGTPDFCSPACPCEAEQGDCDDDEDCASGNVCVKNVGASYGFAADVDVCLDACDPALSGDWDFCSDTCLCEHGQGDCDRNADCAPGHVCVANVGAEHGYEDDMDVCVRVEELSGLVLGQDGQRLSGVEVSVNGQTTTTGADGAFAFTLLAEERYVISATRPGFVPSSQVHIGSAASGMTIVLRAAESFTVAPDAPISIMDSRGATIAMNAGALVDEDGNPPAGDVTVHVYSYDVQHEPMLGNSMEAIDSNGAPVALESVGAISVDIVDEAGRRYQLAPGQTARISVVVPDDVTYSGEIPMWHFDMAQGLWREEGGGLVQAGRAEAEVSHFSTWNFDFKVTDTACLKVTATTPLVPFGGRVRARVVVTSGATTRERSEDLVGNAATFMINLAPHAQVEIFVPPNATTPRVTVPDVGAGHGGSGLPADPDTQCASVAVAGPAPAIFALTSAPSSFADGYAYFGVDAFGSMCECTGTGIRFNPLGATHGLRELDFLDRLYVFDQGEQWAESLGVAAIPPAVCGAFSGLASAVTDMTVGGSLRVSEFVLTARPEVSVHLVQAASGATLTQTYTFTNNGTEGVDLRLTRVADFDLVYTVTFPSNTGQGAPPNGASVIDGAVSATITASGSATLDGWRVFQAVTGYGAAEHLKAWANFGFDGASLNGIFANQNGAVCNIDETAIATPVVVDTAASVQSRLSLDPGESGTFVTQTILSPGI